MKRRYSILTGALGLLALSGCHVDQWQQPKVKYDGTSDFFRDEQGNRPLVAGAVPVGGLRLDKAYFEGKLPTGKPVPTVPAGAVTASGGPKELLDRGENRYNVFCSPCHGVAGDGNGFIAQRGLGYWQKVPSSLHLPRLRKVEDGHLYDVITHGKGVMYGYAARIPDPNDRWAIVSYVRVLQAAQLARTGAVAETAPEPVVSATPSPAATPAAEEIKKAQADINAVLAGMTGDVLFDTGKTTIKPAASAFLDKLAAVLAKDPGVGFEIGGHTDSQGNATSNMKLSEGRANAVRTYLVSKGIAGERLTARGYGSTKPVADNASAEGRTKNRRITFTANAGGAK